SVSADFRATDLEIGIDGCYKFNFLDSVKNRKLPIQLGIPGKHNVFNATAATACCALKNLDLSKVSEALKAFNGIARRFEISAAWNDITIVDDYAHHPTEIQATLSAAKDAFPNRRIWALWQPHTFSRTQTLLPKFIKAFDLADKLLITNIYASRETQTDFGFEDLKKAMINAYPDGLFAETNEQAVEILMNELQPGDVVITLSAGDANQIGPKALERLRAAANDSVKKPHGVILKNEPIAKYSKAMCGGPAKELVIVRSKEDLVSIIKEYQSSGKPFKVVGGLSNILFSDNGFDGLLVINQSDEISFEPQEEKVLVTVDSGAELNRFVKACAEESLTGAEWASLIPGTVGGAIYGNAGAYGGDISHILRSVQFLTDNNEIVDLRNEDLGFGYRTSKFKSGELKGTILSGTFELSRGNYDEIHEKMAVIAEKRQKFNFHGNGSLGSVFRNPQGNYAGKLITECGFNGKRFGNVKVMDDHGNIFITYPGVKSSEFIELIHRVHDAVWERFSIDLTTEIEIMN
ncbi:MAG TPA: UDP-N-acetylmuramate dehydrogenase, partial [Flexilinea sp.]|nr:UDP-N-acetylmuramate dehydrogenase [Flexilinea sp.]